VGGKSFKSKKKKKKETRWGCGETIKLQNKTEIRAEKGQTWHRDRKENPISAPSIQVGALVGAGSLWPFLMTCLLEILSRLYLEKL
jgi:hypothetical protein